LYVRRSKIVCEASLSNFSQMAVIIFLQVVSAATGLAAAAGFMRGLSRKNARDIGNYWVDFTRVIYRVMLPLSFVVALILVWQGIPQTLDSATTVTTLEVAQQHLVMGPVASLESIKHIGTNGGGFFGANAAHPYENPTPLTNFINMLVWRPRSRTLHRQRHHLRSEPVERDSSQLAAWLMRSRHPPHRSIAVPVIDRGPLVRDRLLDLSQAAARLGMARSGLAKVRVALASCADFIPLRVALSQRTAP
jgi:hypothetical protein